MTKQSYQALGASASKKGLHRALQNAGMSEGSGLFAQVIPDIAGDSNFHSFLHSDGAGTKSIVAYLACKESGRDVFFAGLAQDALVMNLDDVFCIGSPESLVLANTIGRNARLVNDSAVGVIIASYKNIVEKFKALGISIQLSGGETADCGDVVRTLIVDAVLFGRIRTSSLINAQNITPGDAIVGLSSTGKATYENSTNSGIASNGLTLARHSLLTNHYLKAYPEVVDPGLDSTQAYQGPFKLSDCPQGLGMSVGEALLSPTRSYAPLLLKLYQALESKIHGVIHVTGGGQTKVLRFGKNNLYVKNNLFETPAIFSLIQQHGNVDWKEMYQVFNMGHRIELYLPKNHIDQVIEIANSFGIIAQQIGHVERNTSDNSKSNKVVVESVHGRFEYQL